MTTQDGPLTIGFLSPLHRPKHFPATHPLRLANPPRDPDRLIAEARENELLWRVLATLDSIGPARNHDNRLDPEGNAGLGFTGGGR